MSSSSLSRSFCGQKSAPPLTLAAAVPPQRFPGAVLERTSKSAATHAAGGAGGRLQHGSNRTPGSAVTALQAFTVGHFRAPARLLATAVITVAGAVKTPRARPAAHPPRAVPRTPPPALPAHPAGPRGPARPHGNWPKRFPPPSPTPPHLTPVTPPRTTHPTRSAPGHPGRTRPGPPHPDPTRSAAPVPARTPSLQALSAPTPAAARLLPPRYPLGRSAVRPVWSQGIAPVPDPVPRAWPPWWQRPRRGVLFERSESGS